MESMNDQPDEVRRGYDRAGLERLLIEHERMLEIHAEERDEVDQEEIIMSDMQHGREMRELDDQLWDEAWDQFLDEVYLNEQVERERREDDERRNDQ